MIIYADILIIVNFAVDYFLLRLTAVLLKIRPPLWRTLTASLFAALTSLYIFLPQSPVLTEIAVRIVFCFLITFVGFGYKNFSAYMRTAALFFGVTFGFAGLMMAVFYIFRPPGMAINNSVVYFSISPVLLIVSSALFYFAVTLIKLFWGRKNHTAERCEVTLFAGDKNISLEGIVDTGNGITDPFTGRAVMLVGENDALLLFDEKNDETKSRFRAIPCKTVTGSALLKGYRTDKAVIKRNGKRYVFKDAVAAVSNTQISEHGILLNPDIFD